MNEIYLLPQDERELFFRASIDIKNMPFEIIEKDYWVVWVLKRLFSLENMKPYLTFKGGTSLSKVYGLIDRFSEDIDLSIEREFFGFDAPHNPENAPSKKNKKARSIDLSFLLDDMDNYGLYGLYGLYGHEIRGAVELLFSFYKDAR